MSRIQKNENQIVIKGDYVFIYRCLSCAVITFFGISIFLSLPIFHSKYGVIDIGMALFLLVWIAGVICLSIYSFLNFNKKIIIDQTGVKYSCIFVTKHYDWSDIKDYGISGLKWSWVSNTRKQYNFYFLNKKPNSDSIKMRVFGNDYNFVVENIIPYCEKHLLVQPFIEE